MQAAQNIIKSRTGNAIIKQAYGAADRQAEKKARLIEHKKGKELRKLALEKVQFIYEQDEKLKRKEPEKTRAKKQRWYSNYSGNSNSEREGFCRG